MSVKRPRVFLTQSVPMEVASVQQLKQECDVTIYDETVTGEMVIPRDQLLRDVRGIDGLFLALPVKIDAELLDVAGPQLKVIATQSVGLDHVDVTECVRRKIPVGFTPDVLTDAVAEATIALTLTTARRYKEGMQATLNGTWGSTFGSALWMCGKELKGSVVGIVGLGRIGFAVARRLKAFGIQKLLYSGSSAKSYASEIDGEFVPFNDLLAQSDFVIACCSINKSNHKLFNKEAFKVMKSSAILINTSRGILIDQEALYEALTSGEIYAAGLDVTSPEPLPTDHPLLALPNCTIIPHLGSATVTTRLAMTDLTARNVLAGLKGETLPSPVPTP